MVDSTLAGSIPASKVKGTDVYNREGEHLGHIDDIVLQKESGKAEYAVMSFGGFLGMGEQYHTLPWEALKYDTSRDGYIVSVTREQLEGGPTHAPGEDPEWDNQDYRRHIFAHYGYPHI